MATLVFFPGFSFAGKNSELRLYTPPLARSLLNLHILMPNLHILMLNLHILMLNLHTLMLNLHILMLNLYILMLNKLTMLS